MRQLLMILLICIASKGFSQDIQTLENELQNTFINDLPKIREVTDSIYKLDPYNEKATYTLASAYSFAKLKDSIPSIFTRLKNIDPCNPTPYILSAKYQFDVKYQFDNIPLFDTALLAELRRAIMLDSNNFEAHYLLGKYYYALFNKQRRIYYADQSRRKLIKATELKSTEFVSLKYPIVQLSYFLEDTNMVLSIKAKKNSVQIYNDSVPPKGILCYPFRYFLDFKPNWETDPSFDVMDGVDAAAFRLTWYSDQLYAMKEPIIFNRENATIYRFTWLRTFHHTIAIRLEKTGNVYTLYWKMMSGAGGYKPGTLVVNKSKKLTQQQWDTFIHLLQAADLWNMPTYLSNNWGTDGSRWLIEGLDNNHQYHVVDRWTPQDDNYEKCGKNLISLTDLELKKNEMY